MASITADIAVANNEPANANNRRRRNRHAVEKDNDKVCRVSFTRLPPH